MGEAKLGVDIRRGSGCWASKQQIYFSILHKLVLFLKVFKVAVFLLDSEFLKGKYYLILIFEYLAPSEVPGSVSVC